MGVQNRTIRTLLKSSLLLLLGSCVGNQTAAPPLETSTIKIGGSAETYEVLELLSEAYAERTPGIEFTFFPPSQTSGGLQGVKSNAIDLGGVSRHPSAEEIDEQLTYIPLVETPLVVAVHDSVIGVSNITSDQIKAIYSGKINNWEALGGPDEAIVLLDFTEDENEKKVLRKAHLGNDLVITPTAIVFPEDDELIKTAAITEFSLATIPYKEGIKDLPLRILEIDGTSPFDQLLETYDMTLPLGVVMNKQPSATTQEFVDFVAGPEGKQVLSDTDYSLQ